MYMAMGCFLWARPHSSGEISRRVRQAVRAGTERAGGREPPEPDVELRSASVLDYRIWRPQGRVTMLHGSLGTHRALSQI